MLGLPQQSSCRPGRGAACPGKAAPDGAGLTVEDIVLGGAGAHDLVKGKGLRLVAGQHGGDGVADDLRQARPCMAWTIRPWHEHGMPRPGYVSN